MHASISACRTSSILSGLIRIDSAMAAAVLLASSSMSGAIGSASVTSLKMASAMIRFVAKAERSKRQVNLESVDHDRMNQILRQQPKKVRSC